MFFLESGKKSFSARNENETLIVSINEKSKWISQDIVHTSSLAMGNKKGLPLHITLLLLFLFSLHCISGRRGHLIYLAWQKGLLCSPKCALYISFGYMLACSHYTMFKITSHLLSSNTRGNKKLIRAVKVAIPAGGWKIKVNDFYRTVRHVLCRWHPKTVQDSTLFQTYSFPSRKNATFSNQIK